MPISIYYNPAPFNCRTTKVNDIALMRVKLTKESERHLMSRTSGENTMRIDAIPMAPKDMVLSEGKIGTVSHNANVGGL